MGESKRGRKKSGEGRVRERGRGERVRDKAREGEGRRGKARGGEEQTVPPWTMKWRNWAPHSAEPGRGARRGASGKGGGEQKADKLENERRGGDQGWWLRASRD